MLEVPLSGLLLAGFTLAHAIWSVSDTGPEELLAPLAILESGGQRVLQRYEAPTQEQAIARARADYPAFSASYDAWAFAREGTMRLPSSSREASDVVVVDFWAKGMAAPVSVVQPFERSTERRGFRLVGEPIILRDGRILDPAEAKPLVAEILKGVANHPHVAALWNTWK